MPDHPAPLQSSNRDEIDTTTGALAPDASLLNDTIESRARLCFRALSMGLATTVLMLIAMSLHAVTGTFVEHARILHAERPHAMPADMVDVDDVLVDQAPPSQGWPHAIVAVISILLVGEIVLAIGMIRATFSMRVNTDAPPAASKEPPSSSIGLPGIELLKAATETIETVLKGLPKR
ncbi:hypothetical protein CDL60_14340 [Roseateles noduli]|nr:hypothetical protein CDL60_14340 [Roseateles noduli]